MSLSAEAKPYNSIVTWCTDDISSVDVSNDELKLQIQKEGKPSVTYYGVR